MNEGRPHRVVVLALDGVYPFELGIPHRVFGSAEGRYQIRTCTIDGSPARTDADFAIAVDNNAEILITADTVVVPPFARGALPRSLDPVLNQALAMIPETARLVSICTGAFVLAAAGVLDGRRATTHWTRANQFREYFPRVKLDPNVLFVQDGRVFTSAGASAGVDMCLDLVRNDHGAAVANRVARVCVVPPWREGGQAQYIEHAIPLVGSASTSPTRQWVIDRLPHPITLSEMASHAHMSARTFSRRFHSETGESPAKWLTQQRISRARELLETTDITVEQIALQVGLTGGASLRQHFQKMFGVSPKSYRHTFSQSPTRAAIEK